jgi:anti-sigma B factor antagonist
VSQSPGLTFTIRRRIVVHPAVAGVTGMDEDDDFRVERRLDGEVAVIVPEGDIDLSTADAVRVELAAAEADDAARRIVVDLRQVSFMDSSGIRLLVEGQLAAERDGFDFAVVRGSRAVQRLLELAGLDGRVRVVDDPSEVAGGERPDAR